MVYLQLCMMMVAIGATVVSAKPTASKPYDPFECTPQVVNEKAKGWAGKNALPKIGIQLKSDHVTFKEIRVFCLFADSVPDEISYGISAVYRAFEANGFASYVCDYIVEIDKFVAQPKIFAPTCIRLGV